MTRRGLAMGLALGLASTAAAEWYQDSYDGGSGYGLLSGAGGLHYQPNTEFWNRLNEILTRSGATVTQNLSTVVGTWGLGAGYRTHAHQFELWYRRFLPASAAWTWPAGTVAKSQGKTEVASSAVGAAYRYMIGAVAPEVRNGASLSRGITLEPYVGLGASIQTISWTLRDPVIGVGLQQTSGGRATVYDPDIDGRTLGVELLGGVKIGLARSLDLDLEVGNLFASVTEFKVQNAANTGGAHLPLYYGATGQPVTMDLGGFIGAARISWRFRTGGGAS